jgi:capsular polysaccharide biosynthesis protein
MLKKRYLSKLYKSIIYKIFKLFYGEIYSITKSNDSSDIKEKKIEIKKSKYKIFFCNNSTLYTDRVHDTAVIKDNRIIEGPSFQIRNNIYKECKDNSVFEKGTPRFRKRLKGTVLSLLTGGGGNSNYWHWLFDVLPRLEILRQAGKSLEDVDYFLFPSFDQKFQSESLDKLNIPQGKRLSSKNYRHVKADQIITTSHPYIFLNDPFKDSLNIPLWIFDFLRNKFLKKIDQDNLEQKSFPSKIFINRKDGKTKKWRFIINELEVENFLKSSGFKSVTLSDYSLLDQVKLFYNAKTIVGLHGAGFANIIYSKPGTKVLEFKSTNAGDAIKNLALNNKLNYNDISSSPKTTNHKYQAGDIEIDLKLLHKSLD